MNQPVLVKKDNIMNHTDIPLEGQHPQIPNGPTQLYLLQMDSSINLSLNEQVLPLHLLDNSLEFGCKQYLLPIPLKQKEGQDHLQVLIDPSQGPAKIMGLIVDNKNQNLQNELPYSDIPLPISSTEFGNTGPPTKKMQDLNLPQITNDEQIENGIKCNSDCSTQMIKNFGIKRKIAHSEAVELVLNATSNKKPLFLVKDMYEVITHIDTSDKDKSNWIGLLPLGDTNSANIWIYEENQELFAITTEIVPSRKPLMLGYSKTYADEYGLIGPTKDFEKEPQVQKSWWCPECQQTLKSAKHLDTHTYLCHKEEAVLPKRRYRCRQCRRTFSKIFALRRHTARHCPVQLEKKNKEASDELYVEVPPLKMNVSMCSEDKLPSDESFQNFTNGLDFSTNLFDTDRISSLDISGNSRSDNDFNPYAIVGYKDENGLTSDLDFSIKIDDYEKLSKEKQPEQVEELPAPCPHCNQIVAKGKSRQHVSKCRGRRLKCECEKVFTNMKQFTEHVWAQHSNENESSSQNDNDVNNKSEETTSTKNPAPYKCELCQHSFKRRGMLVNHLWRVHNTGSVGVPLERRVRHFPCGTCPKIYRTAAKRDRHVQKHHPGAAKVRYQALEGGTRVCEPAACPACPRQYATRAKLLQHQRTHHPFLVSLPRLKTTTNNIQAKW